MFLAVLLLAVPTAALLTGCGESGTPSSSASGPTVGASAALAAGQRGGSAAASGAAIAWVSGAPIAKASYEHWLAVERALGAGSAASHRAVGFLVSGVWLLREAARRGVSVSAAQTRARLSQLERKSFSQSGSLKRYLEKAHETEADLLLRVKVEELQSAIAAQVAGSRQGASRAAVLASFQRSFQRRWKSRTRCASGYVMEDCAEYRGGSENLAAAGGGSSAASAAGAATGGGTSSSSSSRRAAKSVSSSSAGEVYSAPGAMSISSPAFERNGAIPTQYTCDGADVSPPLQWQNVPSGAAALVLFVIDDSSSGPASGIRWVVGDIGPTANGVAAGNTPAGGIVGSDTQGHAGYGGICPPRGKTGTVEFVLYALRKKIPLSPGFAPAVAESEYGAGKDLMGSAAVTYAVYHRP